MHQALLIHSSLAGESERHASGKLSPWSESLRHASDRVSPRGESPNHALDKVSPPGESLRHTSDTLSPGGDTIFSHSLVISFAVGLIRRQEISLCQLRHCRSMSHRCLPGADVIVEVFRNQAGCGINEAVEKSGNANHARFAKRLQAVTNHLIGRHPKHGMGH